MSDNRKLFGWVLSIIVLAVGLFFGVPYLVNKAIRHSLNLDWADQTQDKVRTPEAAQLVRSLLKTVETERGASNIIVMPEIRRLVGWQPFGVIIQTNNNEAPYIIIYQSIRPPQGVFIFNGSNALAKPHYFSYTFVTSNIFFFK